MMLPQTERAMYTTQKEIYLPKRELFPAGPQTLTAKVVTEVYNKESTLRRHGEPWTEIQANSHPTHAQTPNDKRTTKCR